jgi:hypothetical protein
MTSEREMIFDKTISPSQSSHGGSLYYVYKIPKHEYHYEKRAKNDKRFDEQFSSRIVDSRQSVCEITKTFFGLNNDLPFPS